MKIVVDTNILFSFFKKDSTAAQIITTSNLDFISSEYALYEIKKYEKEIRTKAKITKEQFNQQRKFLAHIVQFFPEKEYKKELKKALTLSPDPNDIDFFALALKKNATIWSNDKELKNQRKIKIYTTKEMINLFY